MVDCHTPPLTVTYCTMEKLGDLLIKISKRQSKAISTYLISNVLFNHIHVIKTRRDNFINLGIKMYHE